MNFSLDKSFIEQTSFYRGQIVYRWKRPEIASETVPISPIASFNPYSFQDNYYLHQKELVDLLQKNKNVVLLAPFNTGRTTIALLYALDVIFNKQRSALFVSVNKFEKEIQKKILEKILINSRLDWLVDIREIDSENNNNEQNTKGLFPSIFIAEIKDLHSYILPNHDKFSTFFDSLGLAIFDDFERYSGHLATNMNYLIKRIESIYSYYNNKRNSPIQYLILSKPFNESKSIVEGIFDKEFEIIHRDDKEMKSAAVHFWVPAFSKVNIEYDSIAKDMLKRETVRESFIDDSYLIALESLKNGRSTVLFYSNIPFSRNDLKLRERYLNYIKRFKDIEKLDFNNLFISCDWADLTAQLVQKNSDWDEIETIIIASFSGSTSELRDDLLHIGAENAEIFLTMPQTPSFQFSINHPTMNIIKDSKETVKNEHLAVFVYNKNNEELKRKHYILSRYEMLKINDDIFKDKSNKIWNDLHGLETIDEEEPGILYNKIKEIKGLDIFSAELDLYFLLIGPDGKVIGTVTSSEVPDYYFKNAMIYYLNERFIVSKVDLEERKIYLTVAQEFRLPVSQRIMTIQSQRKIAKFNFAGISFSSQAIALSSEINRYKVIFGTDTDPNSFYEISEDVSTLNDLKVISVEIDGVPSIDTFASILNTAIKTKFSLYNIIPNLFTYNDKIYLYNLGSGNLSYFINDANIKDLLNRALTILSDCPCQTGCPGCLETFESREKLFNKKEIIDYLGKLLKRDNIEEVIRWKYEGIGVKDRLREDTVKFREIRNKILNILKMKAGMIIRQPYQEKFMSDDDLKWISASGLCHVDQKTIYIKGGYTEATLIDICAHEYIHNWQFENNMNPVYMYFNEHNIDDEANIWFGGKMFVEGQANLGAAKVLDYYGLREMVYRDEVEGYAQYREGFILLNEMEKKYGLHKLNSILREAKFENGEQITADTINQWYDKTGVKSLIQGVTTELINEGFMKCLQIEYLDKTRDFHRLTYFMQHIINPAVSDNNPLLYEFLKDGDGVSEEMSNKIWKIIKDYFKFKPIPEFDFLPCHSCKYFEKETLDGLCILFGSIDVKAKIMNLKITS